LKKPPTHPPPPPAAAPRPAETLPADAGQAGRFQQVSAIDGRQRLFAYRHLAPYPVHVLVGADLETMLHPWRERRQHAIWLTAGICGAAAAVGLILLALAQRLERRREQFRLAAHAAGVAIWDRQMRKHRFFITREYLERLGYDPRRFGHSLGELLKLVHPEDRARLDDAFFALDASSPAIDATFRLRASDGGYRWFHASGQVVETLLGRPTRISGTLVDVHERKVAEDELRALSARLEQLVDQRTRDLRAANEELEAFSYSVSHDLRAPLRSISGFSEILVQDHAEQLPPDAKPLLRRIVCATERMGALIDDLLALARAARAPITLNPVDLSALADSVAESLRQHEPERKAEFEIAPGLTATADAGLMRIVLENLIANAWKFSRRREVTRIAVGREHTARGDAFYVRDNGSGLDMRYADRLFKPFQRLHHERDFEGTGIGLATVARIVRRHGGAVWIESAPDQGATVYFTLPAPSADASSESLGTSA
jgi:PAS domain S-box-containing protein